MKIGITYNLKEEPPPQRPCAGMAKRYRNGRFRCQPPNLPEDAFEEFDSQDTIDAIASALEKGGHDVVLLGWGIEVVERIRLEAVDFVFNIAEGFQGGNRESLMPALLEMIDVPYSGSDPLTLGLTLDKAKAKRVVAGAGVLAPESRVIESPGQFPPLPPFPLVVKPLHEGSSKGIRSQSKVHDGEALAAQVAWLWRVYGTIPVLAERYIPGREFTVGVLGTRDPCVLGVMEVRYRKGIAGEFFYSLEVKRQWRERCEYVVPPRIAAGIQEEIRQAALTAYKALGCRDVARIDFRVDRDGRVYFIEANPLPGLSPLSSDLVFLAEGMGWSYEKLILTILSHAVERQPAGRRVP